MTGIIKTLQLLTVKADKVEENVVQALSRGQANVVTKIKGKTGLKLASSSYRAAKKELIHNTPLHIGCKTQTSDL